MYAHTENRTLFARKFTENFKILATCKVVVKYFCTNSVLTVPAVVCCAVLCTKKIKLSI